MSECLTDTDFATMRQAGKVAARVLKKLKKVIRPGICTKDIEDFFDRFIEKYPGMEAAFKGFSGYPASLCVSVNEEIIHGIPSRDKVLRGGDIVSVDLGIKYKGLFVDTAYTYSVGRVSAPAKKLIEVTAESLSLAIAQVRDGGHVGDISGVVQCYVEKHGFSVIRKFVGHGIGRELHIRPEVPNFGEFGEGEQLTVGQAVAIEPMVAAGGFDVEILADGWSAATMDKTLSAHFEHTVAVTSKGSAVITR